MCGSAARINRKGASTISASMERKRSGSKSAIGLDRLHARVVDQDVDLEPQVLQRGDVEKVYRPGVSADLVGQRLGATSSTSATVTMAPRAASSRAQAAPMPLAPPVTRARASREVRHPTRGLRSAASSSASASSSAFRSMPLVSRVKTTATRVIGAGDGQVDRDRHRRVVDVEQLDRDERRQRTRHDRGDLIAKGHTGIPHPGREHLGHDRRLRRVHERVDHQAEGDRGGDDDIVAAVHHREGEEAPGGPEHGADEVDRVAARTGRPACRPAG